MKSWLLSLGAIALSGALLLATGCNNDPERYTIVFKQDGYDDVTVTVDAGGSLTTPPKPKDVTGYTIVWDRQTFENITEDLVVNAVATANEYTITYTAEDGVTLDAYTQTVTYDAQYELKTPTQDGYSFDGWYNGTTLVAQSGVWNIASDVTLTALWTQVQAEYYEIKFVHLNGTEEVVEVEKGTTLSADLVPACETVTGHTVTWEVTDFSTVTSGRIINAVKTPNTYKITYQLKDGESVGDSNEVYVVYGDSYTLATPTNSDHNKIFAYWKNAETGEKFTATDKWNIAGDVVLEAKWVDAADPDYWTGNH